MTPMSHKPVRFVFVLNDHTFHFLFDECPGNHVALLINCVRYMNGRGVKVPTVEALLPIFTIIYDRISNEG